MKPELSIYSHYNYLTRTAIGAEILFTVSAMAELIVVSFYIIMISKYWQSAAQSCLCNFELRVLPRQNSQSYNHRHPWRGERKN